MESNGATCPAKGCLPSTLEQAPALTGLLRLEQPSGGSYSYSRVWSVCQGVGCRPRRGPLQVWSEAQGVPSHLVVLRRWGIFLGCLSGSSSARNERLSSCHEAQV